MAMFFDMPKLGMDMEEGTIVKWLKAEQETIKQGEPFAEIETDKSTVEVEAPCDGVILKYYYPEGETLEIGKHIAAIGAAGEAAPALDDAEATPTAVPEKETVPNAVSAVTSSPIANPTVPVASAANGKIRISPRAENLAKKHGIDVALITGTGPAGRIVEKDVRAFMASGAAAKATVAVTDDKEYELIPLTSMRRTIARRMLESTTTLPTFTLEICVDMRRAIALREQLKAKKIKVSYHDIFARCIASAMKVHPLINASYFADGIHQYKNVNVGIAVSIDGGLVVPVVKDIQDLRISEIAVASAKMIDKARSGKLEPDDMTGGHITISNLGMYPVKSFTAIINPPESTILACAGMQKVPCVENGQLIEIPMVSITATFDHRLIDGAYGAGFMATLKEYIEDPATILA